MRRDRACKPKAVFNHHDAGQSVTGWVTGLSLSDVIICLRQVYEYFISHHLTKSFESLFGSITCLPGCFTIYRLRAPDTHKPLFVSQQIIHEYQENRVDTLHMKNLLHLGEDRYLTTLILKHFPTHKTKFVRDAHAFTVAPDDWKVLLSQRMSRCFAHHERSTFADFCHRPRQVDDGSTRPYTTW